MPEKVASRRTLISQCTSVPYLESGLCKLVGSWTTAILHLFSQETDVLINVIMKCVDWDIFGCFHYILNVPRMSMINATSERLKAIQDKFLIFSILVFMSS